MALIDSLNEIYLPAEPPPNANTETLILYLQEELRKLSQVIIAQDERIRALENP